VLLPDGASATAVVLVVWSDRLAAGSPARYDVGLRLVRAMPEDLARMESVLAPG